MPGRNIIYYQGIQDDYSKNLAASPFSHVYLAALHVHNDGTLWLNDWPAEDPRYQSLWGQWVPQWIAAGKSVMLLVGGAGNGTWDTIEGNLGVLQGLLGLVDRHRLTGIDLDIETYGGDMVALVERIIAYVRTYRPGITITMSPIPDQLGDVNTIQGDTQGALAWANVQMYCGIYPDKDLTGPYAGYLQYTNLNPNDLVAAVDLEPACCSSQGDLCTYAGEIRKLANTYPTFAGTAMWEYSHWRSVMRRFCGMAACSDWPAVTSCSRRRGSCACCAAAVPVTFRDADACRRGAEAPVRGEPGSRYLFCAARACRDPGAAVPGRAGGLRVRRRAARSAARMALRRAAGAGAAGSRRGRRACFCGFSPS
jgi:hypothetical protein